MLINNWGYLHIFFFVLLLFTQIVGPYIAFEDIDSRIEDGTITQRLMLKQKFILQRSFFDDSTKNVSDRAVNEFKQTCKNIFDLIPLPTSLEFSLFKSFGIVNDDDLEDNVDEIDTDL